jgi:hypothetical protein
MFDPDRSGLFIWFGQSVWNRGFPKFCPCYLGQKIVRQLYLLPIKEDFLMGYDPKEDPSTYNQFS